MAKHKHRSLARRVNLLGRGTLLLHCEGGMAQANADLQRLVRDRHMVIVREAYPTVLTWRAVGRHWRGTQARITPLGEAFLAQHRKLLVPATPAPAWGAQRREQWTQQRRQRSRYVP